MSLNECEVYFALKSDDINADDITRQLGIQPTSVTKKANPAPKCHIWKYSSGKKEAELIDIGDMSSSIIEVLKPKADKIASIVKEYDLGAVLELVLWISTDDSVSTPAIVFENDTLNFLSKVGASIDIDTYRK